MDSFRNWLQRQLIGTFLNLILTIAAIILLAIITYQVSKPDIAPQKLDSPGPRATIEEGELMTNRYRWPCELIRVVDGDTLEAWIDLDFGVKLSAKLRLEGIDTPEIHTVKKNTEEYKRGIKAKAFVEERFRLRGKKFWIETSGKRRGKYGRFVVNVLLSGGDWLDELLLKAGHATKQEY